MTDLDMVLVWQRHLGYLGIELHHKAWMCMQSGREQVKWIIFAPLVKFKLAIKCVLGQLEGRA